MTALMHNQPWQRKEVIGDATLYLGNCLEIMPTLGNVDVVITDPPYGVGLKYNGRRDLNINTPLEAFTKYKDLAELVYITPGIANMFDYPKPKWVIAWGKPNSMRRSRMGGFNMWEPILFYGRRVIYQDYIQKPMIITERIDHPCPKPLSLLEWVVTVGTNPNHIILDPFMGSGTTGVACINLGRKFIGVEIEEKYFSIACKRIRAAYNQGDLFREAKPPKTEQLVL